MDHYVGIDLHSDNNYIAIIDNDNKRVFKKKTRNDLRLVLHALKPYREQIQGIVVESTYNWYLLVDGLFEEGYTIHLVNPSAIKQYSGLKHSDDLTDAFHYILFKFQDMTPFCLGYINIDLKTIL